VLGTRDNAVIMSSTTPSAKYSCSASPLMLANGSTAIDGRSGNVSAGAGTSGGADVRRVRGREGRVALDRTVEQAQRFVVGLARALIEVLETAQIAIVSVEAVGALALGALDLGLLQPRRDCTDDAGGDEVLQIEDVVEIAGLTKKK
jgi:hypothetical protein